MSKFAVIMPAAGRSSRFHDKNYKKPFAPLANKAVWLHSAEKLLNRDGVKQFLLVIAAEDHEEFHRRFGANIAIMGIEVVEGGAERHDSVAKALARVKPDIDFVCVHDAARPCLADVWISRVFEAAEKHDAAILAIPVAGTLKRVGSNSMIEETVPRTGLVGSADAAGFPPAVACSRPTPSAAATRPPTMPSSSNGSAIPWRSSKVRRSISRSPPAKTCAWPNRRSRSCRSQNSSGRRIPLPATTCGGRLLAGKENKSHHGVIM